MNWVKVTVEKDELVIRLKLEPKPRPSKSGKTLLVASTGGYFISSATIGGKQVSVSVNATITKG